MSDDRAGERGQLLVVFALALVAMIGMLGLVIDGGDTFLQRRDQQNVADAAAMAAGYALVNGQSADSAAQTVAVANGYTHGTGGTTVNVTTGSDTVTVTVARPHTNYFSGVFGFASWDVSATATVRAGVPNGAYGAMPLIFNEDAFYDPDNKNSSAPGTFDEPGTGDEDVPQDEASFNWTIFCTASGNPCNANSNGVSDIIDGGGTDTTIYLDDDIGPLNAGVHTTLFDGLANHVGAAYPVSIVNDEGELIGWAYFHLTGSVGGSTKQIYGWFEDEVNEPPFVISPTGGDADGVFGAYSVKLID
jgi:hypothetical protein